MEEFSFLSFFKSLFASFQIEHLIIVGVVLISLFASWFFYNFLTEIPEGNKKVRKIAQIIKSASFAYLNKQYMIIWMVASILAFILFFTLGFWSTVSFVLGVLLSTVAGFFGMYISTNANSKTLSAAASQDGIEGAAKVATYAASSASFFLHAIGIIGMSIVFVLPAHGIENFVGIGLGASLVSIFARLGGGIFTKGADVGADMVGKIEKSLPEDDPRNPAVIADNVGDNVGDCAGMSADLFESYIVTLTSVGAILKILAFSGSTISYTVLPIFIAGIGIISSLIPVFFMQFSSIVRDLDRYFITSLFMFAVSSVLILLAFNVSIDYIICIIIGAGCMIAILKITEYYTSPEYSPVDNLAKASSYGHGTNIILGLSTSLIGVALPIISISAGIYICYYLQGLIGITFGVLGTVALSPAILILDIFGPITDNAGGIAELSKSGEEVRAITDVLDQAGNTTKAITKGYAIGSAIFAAIIMFFAYKSELETVRKIKCLTSLFDPMVFIGVLLGGVSTFVFSGYAMKAVGEAASAIVQKVREQLAKNPGILEGTTEPEYNSIIDYLTVFSIKKMIVPALIPVIGPILCYLFGCLDFVYRDGDKYVLLTSFLFGLVITGGILSIIMTVAGALWDNTKKHIEGGYYGGKGSETHKAAVTGDTVGDPLKDTAGPSLNSFIKLGNLIGTLLVCFL